MQAINIHVVAYHGQFLKQGEKAWYSEFEAQKKVLKKAGIKTDLGQILLTGRDTDILLIAFNVNQKPVGMAWGRLLKTFTHVDRAFVFPDFRGQKIAERLIAYLLLTRQNLVWNAVHDAMDYIAQKFGGVKDMVEGYKGWVLQQEQCSVDLDEIIAGVDFSRFCDHCKEQVPAGDCCPKCGVKFEPIVPAKK